MRHAVRSNQDRPTGRPSILATAATSGAPRKLELRISDPISLLNEIARRYESPERILMEYVDNALDDVEAMYRANADAYPYAVVIEILIDSNARSVTIRDNCRGMLPETLERIVVNVGESRKRGLTWVNGRFGFGVHAFRAAAQRIRFRTRHQSSAYCELELDRNEPTGTITPTTSGSFPTNTGTGTEVMVGPFDPEWQDVLTVAAVKAEIERHFEHLLARPNLSIFVRDSNGITERCMPFDYASVGGYAITRTLCAEVGGRIYPVDVNLRVANVSIPGRQARFFARGRRINEVAEIKSFLRKSTRRSAVWAHPQLLGFIEVGELARPVITRDDFDRSAGRTALYDLLLTIEAELAEALDEVNAAQRDNSLTRLEDVMRDVLNDLAREDRLRLRTQLVPGTETGTPVPADTGPVPDTTYPTADPPTSVVSEPATVEPAEVEPVAEPTVDEEHPDSPDEDAAEPETPESATPPAAINDDPMDTQGARQRKTGFDVSFGDFPADAEGRIVRSRLIEGTIYVNTSHPDFRERMALTRQGRPRFTDRLAAYLAATVAIHYKDQFYARYGRQPDRRDQLFDEMVAFSCRLESALRPHFPLLQRELGGSLDESDVELIATVGAPGVAAQAS
ncbi:MAG TPA: ATP-binding protein [Gemmatimonadaceae bacterium]|nr:ATP-binding protein [Gemmatimonadaceae bacterium]